MALRVVDLRDRFRATVLGFAVGDALGFPLRGFPPLSAGQATSLADDFAPRPRGGFAKGQFSDDTQVLLAVAESVARERRIDGRATAEELAALWQEGVILQPPHTATASVQAFLAGAPWMAAGAPPGVVDPSCLSRGLVVGLWSEVDPVRVAHGAHVVTVCTHKDPLCAAAAAAVARALQLALSDEVLAPTDACRALSEVAATAHAGLADELYFLPRVLSWAPERALAALRCVGVAPASLQPGTGLPPHVIPVLLSSLYVALRAGERYRDAVALVLRCGGEVDVAAGLTGALVAARLGTEAIPARLRKNVLYGDALVAAADRLFEARTGHEPAVERVGALARGRRLGV